MATRCSLERWSAGTSGHGTGGWNWVIWVALFHVIVAMSACARSTPGPPVIHVPPAADHARVQEGVASWYGPDFHGKTTSSGEAYDMYQLTAAHQALPMGTWVRVTNLENHRTVVARINDRGPFVKGRIIDLSYAAARVLGMVDKGTCRVRVEILQGPTDGIRADFTVKPHYALQLGAFTQQVNADELKRNLEALLGKGRVRVVPDRRGVQNIYRVRVGRYLQREAAMVDAQALARIGFVVLVVTEYPLRGNP